MESKLSSVQVLVLENLYFVEPFDKLVEETGLPVSIVADELKNLIARRWVQVMAYNEQASDFLPAAIYDSDHLDAYHFLATREGLLQLHGLGTT